jgi:uncharacterized protein
MQTLDRPTVKDETRPSRVVALEREPERPPRGPEPRKTSPLDVFVTIVVCLLLWTLLASPILERSAEAGPIGARRTAALTLLRPLVAISNGLFLSDATGAVERALGRDPNEQPGGELTLPAFDLPDGSDGAPARPSPAGGGGGAKDTEGEQEGHGQAHGSNAGAGPQVDLIRTPTPSNKLRVAVIGDSLSQGLGPAIERWINPSVVRVLSLGRQSTGLSREDYFNWQAGMREIVEQFRPDLVFVMLGSNDSQAQISPNGSAIPVGTWEWVHGYRDRAAQLVDEATRAGTRVVWVGIPIVKERQRWGFYRNVNEIYRETASSDPDSTYVDTWNAFEGRDGGYSAFIRNDHGQLVEVRAGDGVHFTPAGYGMLGRLALRGADEAFGMPQRAVTFRV